MDEERTKTICPKKERRRKTKSFERKESLIR